MNSKLFKVLRFAAVAFAFSELQPQNRKERKKEKKTVAVIITSC
jgi:hypothetical protein